ncbi:hypothetical protein [Archangium sp.]|uniref:hypothetical protein n=1 Tax=Archangium sp. TaxID=1872627 RepID=UPI00389A865F
MKKLLAALVLTLSTAALAQSDVDSKAQQESQKNDTSRMKTGIDSTEVLPQLSGAKAEKGQPADVDLMNKAHAFNVKGIVTKASGGDITLSRQTDKLPDVKLDVRDQTKVMLDGKKVALGDIPEGAQVRASFQLDGDNAVALDVNATSPKGVATGGKKSVKKETKDTKGTTAPAPAPAPAPDTQQGTTGTQHDTMGTQPAPKP